MKTRPDNEYPPKRQVETKRRVYFRDAVTGKMVSKKYAEANPDTTVRCEVPVKCLSPRLS